jgi:hypothetical protein
MIFLRGVEFFTEGQRGLSMNKRLLYAMGTVMLLFGCSTQHAVEVRPVEVKPIHITIDVNIRVDRALDDFFGDIDEAVEDISGDVQQEE